MVIAPLLGPNMALALSTALGDLPLLRRAILTAMAGIGTAMALLVIVGVLVHVDPALSEMVSRTGDIMLALASGCVSHGRVVAVSDEPDLREPCRRDNVSGVGHSAGTEN